jgi:CRISPR/Cas system CSM-associated protein Csm3 (group 7 of RAMP superfamily)
MERPYLPAASLRGVLRSHLEREVGHMGGSIEKLFGEVARHQDTAKSVFGRLVVRDATPLDEAGLREVRDHVRVDAKTGAAADGAKFDAEVAGESRLRLYLVYDGESRGDPELVLLREAIRAMEDGDLTCGAKSGWGYGRLRLESTRMVCFQRGSPHGLAQWLHARLTGEAPEQGEFTWPDPQPGAPLQQPLSWIEFEWELAFNGPALVRAPIPPMPTRAVRDANRQETFGAIGQETADHVFITTGAQGKPYLPGSSLRGVLRHHAERVARAMTGSAAVVDQLFGRIKDSSGGSGRKGRIEIGDGDLNGEPRRVYLDHVAIERITGFAADAHKFSTCALASPRFQGTLRIRFTDDELPLVALAAFVLRDLSEGWLWAGGGVTRGYGHVQGLGLRSVTADLIADLAPPEGSLPQFTRAARPGRVRLRGEPTAFHDFNWLWEKAEAAWCATLPGARENAQ